jgi:hypothetical protein
MKPHRPNPHAGCAVCASPIGQGWLMCPEHWARVPKPLQQAVTAAWGRMSRERLGTDKSKSALAQYRQARDAALNAAAEAPTTTAAPQEQA